MITVIDYGMGNPGSIVNMLKYLGIPARLTSDAEQIAAAEKLILPGVGAFDAGMTRLRKYGLIDALRQKALVEKTPILGVCLGLQLFAQGSEEGQLPGLGWLPAEAVRFRFEDAARRLRVPHMGWNEIQVVRPHPILKGLESEARFYFTHSYYLQCRAPELVVAVTEYGFAFHSVIARDNIVGAQFHPEKSHKYGMKLLKNFMEWTP